MNTHDKIELPQGYAERPFDYSGDLYTEGQMRAAIEADRKRRKPQHIDPELKDAIEDAATTRSPVAITKDGRGVMLNYGDEEDRMAEHEDNACAYCCGSGHKGDVADHKRRGEPVYQFRKKGCADWYDGYPDHSDGGGPYETRTLYTTPQPTEPVNIYVETRECHECGHVGINDAHGSKAACNSCDWTGYSPNEDRCPGCGQDGTMTAACPTCGGRYGLLAEKSITWNSAPAAQPAEPVKRKRRYAQGTALGEFGIIPMCDQVDDEPVKVPSDDEFEALAYEYCDETGASGETPRFIGTQSLKAFTSALLARYGQQSQPADPDAERYRKLLGAGLPITYLGEDYHDKDHLDAAIDATGEP